MRLLLLDCYFFFYFEYTSTFPINFIPSTYMNAKLPILFIGLFASLNVHCSLNETSSSANYGAINNSINKAEWTIIDSIDYETLNADITLGKPTMDVGVYLPSNLDPEFKR